jgi:hypothetical protein
MKMQTNRKIKTVVVASLAAMGLKSGAALAEVRLETQKALQEIDAKFDFSMLNNSHDEQENSAFKPSTCCSENC